MLVALIREAECVGCSKCLPPCPVDAIVGAPKFLHTVLIDECIGCGLCVAPCPMDCIEMVERSEPISLDQKKAMSEKAKMRHIAKKKREYLLQQPTLPLLTDPSIELKIQDEIKQSILRVQQKREQNG